MKGISLENADSGKVVLSKEFFEREPIFAAAAKFTTQYYIGIQPFDERSIEVVIHPKDKSISIGNIIHEFCNAVIEQQVKQDLQNRFGKLRDMIVGYAFYPFEKK